jgi:hypothetical protein
MRLTAPVARPRRAARASCAGGAAPGHASWRDYYLSIGEPESELGAGDAVDRLIDPSGRGSAIWFQVVPEGQLW